MLTFKIRGVDSRKYASVVVTVDGGVFDLNLLNEKEAKVLISELKSAIEDLEFVFGLEE